MPMISGSCTALLYVTPVLRSYTSYRLSDRITCTAYSCQVMATKPAPDRAPAGIPEVTAGSRASLPAGPPPAGPSADTHRPRLTKAAVVGQAIALADAEGLDALTIRRLAQEL